MSALYEMASEIIDPVVLRYDDERAMFNALPEESEVRDELYEIIGEMMHDAEQVMYDVAEANRERFINLLKERSAA